MDVRILSIWLWIIVSLFTFAMATLRLLMALDDEAARKRMGRNGYRHIVALIAIRKAMMYVYVSGSFVALGALLLIPLPPEIPKAVILSCVLLVGVLGMGVDLRFELQDRNKLRMALISERPLPPIVPSPQPPPPPPSSTTTTTTTTTTTDANGSLA